MEHIIATSATKVPNKEKSFLVKMKDVLKIKKAKARNGRRTNCPDNMSLVGILKTHSHLSTQEIMDHIRQHPLPQTEQLNSQEDNEQQTLTELLNCHSDFSTAQVLQILKHRRQARP